MSYNVIDRETAARFGLTTDGEYNHHALVRMKGESVIDAVVCWGFKRDNLQLIADKRNSDLQKMREKFSVDAVIDSLPDVEA